MADRAFWLVLSRLWSHRADVLVVVKPDTVDDIGHAAVAYTFVRKVCAHSGAEVRYGTL